MLKAIALFNFGYYLRAISTISLLLIPVSPSFQIYCEKFGSKMF